MCRAAEFQCCSSRWIQILHELHSKKNTFRACSNGLIFMHQKCLSPSTSGWKCKSSLIQLKRSNTQLTVNDIRSDLDLSQMKAECTIKHTVLNDLFYFLVNKYITSLLDFFFFFFKTVKQFPNCFPVKAPFNICTITRHPLLKCNKKKKQILYI